MHIMMVVFSKRVIAVFLTFLWICVNYNPGFRACQEWSVYDIFL